jgi:hypothetical protein
MKKTRKGVSDINSVYDDVENVRNQMIKLLKYYYVNLFIAKKTIQNIMQFVALYVD